MLLYKMVLHMTYLLHYPKPDKTFPVSVACIITSIRNDSVLWMLSLMTVVYCMMAGSGEIVEAVRGEKRNLQECRCYGVNARYS